VVEELLAKSKDVLSNVFLQNTMLDRWIWSLDPDGGYTMRDVYRLLTSDSSHHVVFVWRLLRNR